MRACLPFLSECTVPRAVEAAQRHWQGAGLRTGHVPRHRLHQGVPLRDGLARVVQHLLPVIAAHADERGADAGAAHQLVGPDPVDRQQKVSEIRTITMLTGP